MSGSWHELVLGGPIKREVLDGFFEEYAPHSSLDLARTTIENHDGQPYFEEGGYLVLKDHEGIGDAEEWLQKRGVAYNVKWDAGPEYPAGTGYWRLGMPKAVSYDCAECDYDPMVKFIDVQEAAQAAATIEDFRAWIAEKFPPWPDLEPIEILEDDDANNTNV